MSYGCDTKEEATEKAEKLLSKMTTKGWKIRVWDNLGWHYALEHPCGMSLHVHEYGEKTSYMPYLSPDDHGGDCSIWHDPDQDADDPNEAVQKKIMYAQAYLEPYIQCIEKAEKMLYEDV